MKNTEHTWTSEWVRGYEVTVWFSGTHLEDHKVDVEGSEDADIDEPTDEEIADLVERARKSAVLGFHKVLSDKQENAPVFALAESVLTVCDLTSDPETIATLRREAAATARTLLGLVETISRSGESFRASGYKWTRIPFRSSHIAPSDLKIGEQRLAEVSDEVSMEIFDVLSRDETAFTPAPVFPDGCGPDIRVRREVVFTDGTVVPVIDANIFDGGDVLTLELPQDQYVSNRDGKPSVWTWNRESGEKRVRDLTAHEDAALQAVSKLFMRYGFRL